MSFHLEILNSVTQASTPAEVEVLGDGNTRAVRISSEATGDLSFQSPSDYEGCLVDLRHFLDGEGLLLLCNRFRRDAVVSEMARGKSYGLACHLVQVGKPATQIVNSLDPSAPEHVVTQAEAEKFRRRWVRAASRRRFE